MVTLCKLNRSLLFLLLTITLGLSQSLYAKETDKLNVNGDNVFLEGYDVVSYFVANKASPGSAKHSSKYKNATFHFVSRENREAFEANPEKYMPKYGGFCAFGVAHGQGNVKTNPETFKLYNGELLVFFNDLNKGKQFNTIVPWNADEGVFYTKAEKNWSNL